MDPCPNRICYFFTSVSLTLIEKSVFDKWYPLIREFGRLVNPFSFTFHCYFFFIEGLEHWCSSPMSNCAMHFPSFMNKYFIIRPHSDLKIRIDSCLCCSLLTTAESAIEPHFYLKRCSECHGRSRGIHLELERERVFFCSGLLVQPRLSWMHI